MKNQCSVKSVFAFEVYQMSGCVQAVSFPAQLDGEICRYQIIDAQVLLDFRSVWAAGPWSTAKPCLTEPTYFPTGRSPGSVPSDPIEKMRLHTSGQW